MRKPKDPTTYLDGKAIALTERNLRNHTLRRLKSEPFFWQGFHDHRPEAPDALGIGMVEDPTRPGGWCFTTEGPVIETTDTTYPRLWADDALDRDMDVGECVGRTAQTVTLRQTPEQLRDTITDALYYSTEWRHMDPKLPRLGRSAQAALAQANLTKQLQLEGVAE